MLSAQQLLHRASGDGWEPAAHVLREAFRHPARRDGAEPSVVISHKCATSGPAEAVRLFEYRLEHQRQVTGRRIDNAEHLSGRGLPLQRLVTLGFALGKLSLTLGKLTL